MMQTSLVDYVMSRPNSPLYKAALEGIQNPIKHHKLIDTEYTTKPFTKEELNDLVVVYPKI
jgi:hypothetical protein